MKKIIQAAAMIMLMLLPHFAYAAVPGPYVGVGLGYGYLSDFKDAHKIGTEGGFSGKVFVGLNVTKYIGFEAAYEQFSKPTFQSNRVDGVSFDYHLNVVSLVAKAYAPVGNPDISPVNIYIFMGGGKATGGGNFKFATSGVGSSSNTATVAVAGLGLSYDISCNATAGFEYTRTRGKSGDSNHIGIPQSNLYTINLSYHL